VIQDETGIEYGLLAQHFQVFLYGRFLRPHILFNQNAQRNLARAYRDGEKRPLTFRIGYEKTAGPALQVAVRGGGNPDEERVAAVSPPPRQQDGDEMRLRQVAQLRLREREAQRHNPLPQGQSAVGGMPLPLSRSVSTLSGRDMAGSALAMARLEAAIARQTEEYNRRPRVKNLGARVEENRFVQYENDWRTKVESSGTLNYPQEARGQLSGSLILTARIRSDGSVERVEIDRSSGHPALDETAKRIVRMASPFAEFPPAIRRDFDILEITRRWTFTSGKQLQTQYSEK
jgi:protein TonB